MTPNDFVIWFKGFVSAANTFNITPKQWDLLKEKLAEVNDHPYSISIGTGGFGTTSTGTAFTTGSGAWHYTNTTQKLDND